MPCPACYGSGEVDGSEHWTVLVQCRRCDGKGRISTEPEKVPCPKCNRNPGSGPVGVVLDGNGRTTSCWECKGTGWLSTEPADVAVCECDRCPWKHRGVDRLATKRAAVAHSAKTGHAVALYKGHEPAGRIA